MANVGATSFYMSNLVDLAAASATVSKEPDTRGSWAEVRDSIVTMPSEPSGSQAFGTEAAYHEQHPNL